jgi:hypothetical protein
MTVMRMGASSGKRGASLMEESATAAVTVIPWCDKIRGGESFTIPADGVSAHARVPRAIGVCPATADAH